MIADRYLSVGERVEEKPVFRVAMVDPLRVEVVLPAQLFGSISQGAMIGVIPEFPNAGVREGKVILIDKLIDGASNTFRVRLALPNPDGSLPAGLRCKANLGVAMPAAQRAPAPPAGGFKRVSEGATAPVAKTPATPADVGSLRMESKLPAKPVRVQG